MGKIFDLDSPVMVFLSRIADLIILNIIAVICSIPIVTIGASWTAVHYVALRMSKDQDGYVLQSFFRSFKQNFKQATLIWLMVMVIFLVMLGDFLIIRFGIIKIPSIVQYAVLAISVFMIFVGIYIFPVLARFDNTIKATLKNAFLMSILNLPRTLLMMVIYVIPVGVLFVSLAAVPVVLLLGLSGPAYLASLLCWKKIFAKIEPEEEVITNEYKELGIFSEEYIEAQVQVEE